MNPEEEPIVLTAPEPGSPRYAPHYVVVGPFPNRDFAYGWIGELPEPGNEEYEVISEAEYKKLVEKRK